MPLIVPVTINKMLLLIKELITDTEIEVGGVCVCVFTDFASVCFVCMCVSLFCGHSKLHLPRKLPALNEGESLVCPVLQLGPRGTRFIG